MFGRHRRHSIHEVRHIEPFVEDKQPQRTQVYNLFRPRKQTIIYKTTTVHRRHKEQIERSPSPRPYRRRQRTPSPPPLRRPCQPQVDTPFTMSPINSKGPKQDFVPLPDLLPKKVDQKTKNEKPYVKTHKPSYSADTGYASGVNSPYAYEDRSPDLYSKTTTKPHADTMAYETVDSEPRDGVTYITKDGRKVRYVSSKKLKYRGSENEYVSSPTSGLFEGDKYKSKYKGAKQQTRILQEAFEDSAEAAQYNLAAAKKEESERLENAAQIEALEARLRGMVLQTEVLQGVANEEQRKRINAERKLEQKGVEAELAKQKQHLALLREQALERRHWEEIASSPSPTQRKRQSFPAIVNQEERKSRSALATTGYGQSAMTTATKSPSVLAPANPFMDAIFEAQNDYDASRTRVRGDEDRRRATDIKYEYTSSRRDTKERPRGFHK